jgi:AraC-like DNA-binding protein
VSLVSPVTVSTDDANALIRCATTASGTVPSMVDVLPPAATVLSSWTRALIRALEARDVDALALARAAGIPLTALDDPERRVPLEASTRLWKAAVAATGDHAIGLEVSRHVRPTTFHGLGQAFLASTSLAAALERTARHSPLIYDPARATAGPTEEGFVYTLGWRPGAVAPAAEAVDAVVAAIVRGARFMLGRQFDPLGIRFERPEPPAEARGRFEGLFRCPMTFGHDTTELVYGAQVAHRQVPDAHPGVARSGETAVATYLARISSGSTVDQVRRVLAEALPLGEPAVAAVARTLDRSSRTLQRQLEEEGTTFREVLNDLRAELARAYLRDGEHTIAEITYLLGFSETAAFSRAFKRWTGVSPSRFGRPDDAAGDQD